MTAVKMFIDRKAEMWGCVFLLDWLMLKWSSGTFFKERLLTSCCQTRGEREWFSQRTSVCYKCAMLWFCEFVRPFVKKHGWHGNEIMTNWFHIVRLEGWSSVLFFDPTVWNQAFHCFVFFILFLDYISMVLQSYIGFVLLNSSETKCRSDRAFK